METLFKELAERLKSNDKQIANCCLLRDKLQICFNDKNLKIKLDLFHAINRFSQIISTSSEETFGTYRNIFHTYGDYSKKKKRRKITPDENMLKKNLKLLKKRWICMRHKGGTIFNQKSEKALDNIELHIDKGCLSDIPLGAGTNRNERMHLCRS